MADLTLLIGSNNQHKIEEIRTMLVGIPINVIGLQEAGIDSDVEETGTTFEENARLKAETYAELSGLPTIADDSGLEVAVLNGAPGIYTARWALDEPDNPHRAYARVLDELKGRPFHDRIARFVCVIAFARPDQPTEVVEGILPGIIAETPRGVGGFGYDPVFYVLEHDKHLAELPPAEKNRISHRGQAMGLIRANLEAWIQEQ